MLDIKIIDEPRQKFSLILEQQRVTFELWYSQYTNRWSLSLSIDGDPVLEGVRIVPGTDILAPFQLGIGKLFAYSMTGAEPGRDDLPQGNVRLFHTTQDEVDAAVAA